MKTCSKCKEDKDPIEFSKDVRRKDGRYPQCKLCRKNYQIEHKEEIRIKDIGRYNKNKEKVLERQAIYNSKNKDKKAAYNSLYREINKDQVKTKKAIYYQENREAINEKNAEYYLNNREKIIAQRRPYDKKYRQENKEREAARIALHKKENPGLYSAKEAKRRSAKLKRTPKWLTKDHLEEIRTFYIKANDMTKSTGILYTVDHIIPLQGSSVSGLHVPWNLQVLIGPGPNGNFAKHNKV